MKEAAARIKINKLLEESGWRFLANELGPANVVVELNTKLTVQKINDFGEDFESVQNGFIDFLLLDQNGIPLVVLEAKAEDKEPLIGKEQARTYAREMNCRFVILSNGNLHYFWDIDHGNPVVISRFPECGSFKSYRQFEPKPERLVAEPVDNDYIALTQLPNYEKEAGWNREDEREEFVRKNSLRFMRRYQLQAVHAIQAATKEGNNRYLFEMATGTGKTLTAAAVIKLFLKSGNARRVLFLVDRLELEDQAQKAFTQLLKNDYKSVIYKENREDWRKAEIVVTTVQSLLFNNKFQRLFEPTDFDLVISDEAHRSIGGNARAVFEYFIGYKLGLTATPRDYLKNFSASASTSRDPRETERRMLFDTYRTFGCESGNPTFRYSLVEGVKDGFLINPFVVDARTDITTQLLSDEGYAVPIANVEGVESDEVFGSGDFEKRFYSEPTNQTFCKAFLDRALRDPISNEVGKSIVFAVSQKHAGKLVQILNQLGHEMFPGKYRSDFAMQVTSSIPNSQQFTLNFANNKLSGSANFIPDYATSKTRICVTVGMMTTGYDCPDILNLALMRPVFSPSEFVQIKGRGTRKHNFSEQWKDPIKRKNSGAHKTMYKFFDFFANCEYFEDKFDYNEVIVLPKPSARGEPVGPLPPPPPIYVGHENFDPDALAKVAETQVGADGMRIDRMLFEKFEDAVKADGTLIAQIEAEHWDQAIDHVLTQIFDKPEEYFNLEKLREAAGVDRRIGIREILEKAFGRISRFKTKDEVLEEEFQKLILDLKPEDPKTVQALKYFFKAYISDQKVRAIIDSKRYTELNVNPSFTTKDFKDIPEAWRTKIPEYVKDYVSLNQFM